MDTEGLTHAQQTGIKAAILGYLSEGRRFARTAAAFATELQSGGEENVNTPVVSGAVLEKAWVMAQLGDTAGLDAAVLAYLAAADGGRFANSNVDCIVDGKTLLHLAARNNQYDLVQLLFRHGATLDVKDLQGRTPKDVAIQYGH
jgi:Ankyrin repeats (3 copies)